MVIGRQPSDEECRWIVMPAEGNAPTGAQGDVVAKDAVVRLNHVSTRRNLHSHSTHPSPLSQQQEVTAFGHNGIGNTDDNWQIVLAEGNLWKTSAEVSLKHRGTGFYLHSHSDRRSPQFTNGEQEITCYKDIDENNLWLATKPTGTMKHAGESSKGDILNWKTLAVVNICGSIASITGWSFVTLRPTLATLHTSDWLGMLLSASLFIGLSLLASDWIISVYNSYKERPRSWRARSGVYLAGGSTLFLVACLLYLIIPVAGHLLGPFIRYVFG